VYLDALEDWLPRLPDEQPTGRIAAIRNRSAVQPPGIEPFPVRGRRPSGAPLHVVWAARWEHDKDPETFFAALERLRSGQIDFRVSVLGESFTDVPECFAAARRSLGDRVARWGYLESRAAYRTELEQADVFVSTARHEFFGISAAEAIAAGCFPLLPDRLAYPELVGGRSEFLYDGTAETLAARIADLAGEVHRGIDLTRRVAGPGAQVESLTWANRARAMDDAVERLCTK
jgi:glycosyltransferase involved in cell wall biosynthesis